VTINLSVKNANKMEPRKRYKSNYTLKISRSRSIKEKTFRAREQVKANVMCDVMLLIYHKTKIFKFAW